MPLSKSLFLLLFFVTLTADSAGMQLCIKTVFSNYCLGGALSQQLEQNPVDMQPVTNGERSGVIYKKDNEKIYVMAYKGIIYKVLHTYEPETLVTMWNLKRRLQRKYGNYQDLSEYPDDTQNKSRQVSLIRRGEGELKHVWQLPGQPWRLELGWTDKLGITIAYFVNELDEMQKEAALREL